MPRQYNIRWRAIDEQTLRRTIKNYNAKRTRLIRSGVKETLLPERLLYKDVKNMIGTRADYNRTVNRIKRFSRRGSEQVVKVQGVNITKYELNELRYAIRRSNKIKKSERNYIESQILRTRGESVGYTVGMGDIDLNALRQRELNLKNKSRKKINEYFKSFQDMASDRYYMEQRENYKRSYLKGFRTVFQGMPYFEEFYRELKRMSTDQFAEVYYTDLEGSIKFFYDQAERDQKYMEVIGIWNRFLSNELKEQLNNF